MIKDIQRNRISAWLLLSLLCLMSCQKEVPQQNYYDDIEIGSPSTLMGTVLYNNIIREQPEFKDMDSHCPLSTFMPPLQINPSGRVQGTIVSIKFNESIHNSSVQADIDPNTPSVISTIDTCNIMPRQSIMLIGESVRIINNDEKPHTVFLLLHKNPQKKALLNPHQDVIWTIEETGPYKLGGLVDGHWRESLLYVDNSPYITITGSDGSFGFSNIYAESIELHAYHQIFGEISRIISLRPGKSSEITLEF